METNRCLLSIVKQSDFRDIKNLFQNQKVRKYLGGVRTEASINKLFEDMLSNVDDSKYWTIRILDSNEFVGLVSLDTHHNNKDLEVSYQLLPNWWGNGYATEVINHVIKFAFETLNVSQVVAETQTANIQSSILLEKVGMKLTSKYERFNAEQSFYVIKQEQ